MLPFVEDMENNKQAGMTLIIKAITRLLAGFILLYGIYIVLHGHISPGGGFSGGVIIALSFINIFLAFGSDFAFRRFSQLHVAFFESLGALMFLEIAFLGFVGGVFFLNFLGKGKPFDLFSAGTIPLCNIAIAFKVAAGLLLIFVALVVLSKADESGDKT
jgi:multicomponent Na+:H+ antiporter subunit B